MDDETCFFAGPVTIDEGVGSTRMLFYPNINNCSKFMLQSISSATIMIGIDRKNAWLEHK